ncbi:carboxypeptidase B2 isoform X3 [Triplophysa rosa]|uniref:Carboxypeptidase B2 n=2 Tax=Triplophysa rosa TaxID=992332 RepID=A0A9W7TNB1_TRIRA|nr:carboxypeptidase B2 isoform X3 [Triplophysa rosa]KAI7800472.1 carboxypeptidase B2 precursor [Triplophysa rosa]
MKPLTKLLYFMCFNNFLEMCMCTSEHDQVLSITVSTQDHVDTMQNLTSHNGTVLWQPASPSYITTNSEVHLYVQSTSVELVTQLLQQHRIPFTVLVENTEELVEMQTRNNSSDPRSGGVYHERYHSLEDIYFWINQTSQEHSDMVKVILIGSSFEKRPLHVMKLSGRRGAVNRAMWMDCGIHAREWIAPAFCLWFVNYALRFYSHNSEITEMLNNMDIYILPVMNPDGYKYTWTTDRMWRKNRSVLKEGSECVGVDLNRNFDARWCTKGASNDPCDPTYCGQYPESEPEAQAVAKFLRSHKDTVKLYISIHSYSQMLLFPYSCSYDEAPNHNELLELTKEASTKIRRYYRNHYKYGPGAKTIYLAPGGSDDWAYNLGIKYSFTFELQDRGRYGFLLPPSFIPQACNEALLAVKITALHVIKNTQ